MTKRITRATRREPWDRPIWLARARLLWAWSESVKRWASCPGGVRCIGAKDETPTRRACLLRLLALQLAAAAETIDLLTRTDPPGEWRPSQGGESYIDAENA